LLGEALCHEDKWGSGGLAPLFLTSALDGDEWSAPHHGRFTPGVKAPGVRRIGSWVGPRADLSAVKTMLQYRESKPARLACGPSLYRLSYPDSRYF
jgi:hypothetical protein